MAPPPARFLSGWRSAAAAAAECRLTARRQFVCRFIPSPSPLVIAEALLDLVNSN